MTTGDSTKKLVFSPSAGMNKDEVFNFQNEVIEKSESKRVSQSRAFSFERRKRLPYLLSKGLSKPGRVSFDVLRRAVNSVHAARICVNVLKEKVIKTKWNIQAIDPKKEVDPKRLEQVQNFFKYPNQNETFRTLLNKILEDLLILDVATMEKTRFENGVLAEIHHVDGATVRPVFDEHGNNDVLVPIVGKDEKIRDLPVSFVQVMNSNPWGGREMGDLVAAWPKKDFVSFNMHPQGSMDYFGYGMSPIEAVLGVVGNILNADNFNGTYFEEGSFPPAILQLKANIDPRELESLREYLYAELAGRFHRPAIFAGDMDMDVKDLKNITQRDMQFMQYMEFMIKLLAAAYGLSGQDVGLSGDINKTDSETQKDLSQAKGYGAILSLLKDEFNQQIIWKDFGYDDIEFEWIAPDTEDPTASMDIYTKGVEDGLYTINEVRKKLGEEPYGEWADQPMIKGADGYMPIVPVEDKKEKEVLPDKVGHEEPFKDQSEGEVTEREISEEANEESERFHKSVLTKDGYECFVDDRGFGQPFICYKILTGEGYVCKPPVAVNLNEQKEEEDVTNMLVKKGYNVVSAKRMTLEEIYEKIIPTDSVRKEFENYQNMAPAYDSKKWSGKFGHSRKYPYYLVSEYVDGMNLKDAILVDDMKRAPQKYFSAIDDLIKLWLVEKKYQMGDRRADQYIIANKDKRAWGFDYQFLDTPKRWEASKNSIPDVLRPIPQLYDRFMEGIKKENKDSIAKRIFDKINKK
jgi:hypothetical protein